MIGPEFQEALQSVRVVGFDVAADCLHQQAFGQPDFILVGILAGFARWDREQPSQEFVRADTTPVLTPGVHFYDTPGVHFLAGQESINGKVHRFGLDGDGGGQSNRGSRRRRPGFGAGKERPPGKTAKGG